MDTIRIIHNLPRSGGTIISKSISAQEGIVLLSEIHPQGINIREKMGDTPDDGDPLHQFQSWYKLFDDKDYIKIKSSNLNFLDKIKIINEKAKKQKKILVLRDWSFIDFFGKPFTEPTQKNSLIDTLLKNFKIRNIFLIRDPIEMYISCNRRLAFFSNNYSFDTFLDGYSLYIKNIERDKFVEFEKFIQNPTQILKKISKILDFDFDENYNQNLGNINITGDLGASGASTIENKKSMFNLLDENQKEKINKNKKYREIKRKLSEFN